MQHLLWECCARHLAKCKSVCFAKEKYRSCSKVITNFSGRFVLDFSLTYYWVGLKPFGHSAVEVFDKGVGFSWRAYQGLSSGFTCADSVMSPLQTLLGAPPH